MYSKLWIKRILPLCMIMHAQAIFSAYAASEYTIGGFIQNLTNDTIWYRIKRPVPNDIIGSLEPGKWQTFPQHDTGQKTTVCAGRNKVKVSVSNGKNEGIMNKEELKKGTPSESDFLSLGYFWDNDEVDAGSEHYDCECVNFWILRKDYRYDIFDRKGWKCSASDQNDYINCKPCKKNEVDSNCRGRFIVTHSRPTMRQVQAQDNVTLRAGAGTLTAGKKVYVFTANNEVISEAYHGEPHKGCEAFKKATGW